jgi:shikimate kinase
MENIILIGMPGAGKSTIGVLLAKRLGFGFLDTDLEIQSGEGRRLHQIIEDLGRSEFCRLEEKYVQRLSCRRTVVATGGSVVYSPLAMQHLTDMGTIVYLDVPLPDLVSRLGNIDARGVVRSCGQTLEELYQERTKLYLQYADRVVQGGSFSPGRMLEEVAGALSPARDSRIDAL